MNKKGENERFVLQVFVLISVCNALEISWSMEKLRERCQGNYTLELVLNLSIVSNWCSTFQPYVKMVFTVKCWMKNADVANGLFLILKISDMACQLKLNIYIYI